MKHIKLHVYTDLDLGIHEVILKKESITKCETWTAGHTTVSTEQVEIFGLKREMMDAHPTKIYENGVELGHAFVESVGYIYELLKENSEEEWIVSWLGYWGNQ